MESNNHTIPQWQGWETVKRIGRGGYGSVYEIHREFHGTVEKAALKVISIPANEDEISDLRAEGYDENSIRMLYDEEREEIIKEYKFMCALKGNSNIVKCEDIMEIPHDETIGWTIMIKMELLTPLMETEIMSGTELDVVILGKDICKALELCEQRNVIHRDIKPQNMFLSKSGEYKLGDFGISRTLERTTKATKTGTPDYMAPEVQKGARYNKTVDIYSLGLVLYWMLNEKRLPFVPANPTASERTDARKQRMEGIDFPKPKHGSEELFRVIEKACAYRPEKRFQSAKEMHDALEQAERAIIAKHVQPEALNTPGEENAPEPVPMIPGKKKKSRMPMLLVLAVILLAGGYCAARNLHLSHEYEDATCTSPKICRICQKQSGKPKGHEWIEADCLNPKRCAVCGQEEGEPAEHRWIEATCTEPQSCEVCGTAEGEANGHEWQEATCLQPQICRICGTEEGGLAEHVWLNATCTEPQICSVCGAEEAAPLGHHWVSSGAAGADVCAEPAVCLTCGETKAVLGHDWKPATCTSPKTCRVCGKTEGEYLGHLWMPAVACTGVKECDNCGRVQEHPLNHIWMPATCTSPKTCIICGTKVGEIEHRWLDATCTEAKTCEVCGKTEGSPLGHDWEPATCLSPKICRICQAEEGIPAGHEWLEATCLQPKTCILCGEKEGRPSNHNWEPATCTSPQICSVCGTEQGKPAEHQWKAATCTQAQICEVCGAENGSPLGHDWEPATCTSPQTCRICKTEQGKPAEHHWTAATCTQAQICEVCGAENGSPLGHDWIPATCTSVKRCAICNTEEGKLADHEWIEATALNARTCKVCAMTEGRSLLAECKPGDRIMLGAYDQDMNHANGNEELEWIVLDRNEDQVLLVTDKVIGLKPFADNRDNVTWATSSLREWLNDVFYNNTFSEEEKAKILLTPVLAEEHTYFKKNPADDTEDHVFLLSLTDYKQYFTQETGRCEPTTAAKEKYGQNNVEYISWWLRSRGDSMDSSVYVNEYGKTSNYGVATSEYGVRPAVWVSVDG